MYKTKQKIIALIIMLFRTNSTTFIQLWKLFQLSCLKPSFEVVKSSRLPSFKVLKSSRLPPS